MRLIADLHTHSVASGHSYSTIQEMFAEAANKGLQALAITDHGPAMPGGPHIYHFGNMRVLPVQFLGIRLLKGVEANVVDREGNLDMPEIYLQKLDIVLAGMHDLVTPCGSVEENTATMLKVMGNPFVDVIVHPGNPAYNVDYEKVLETAKDYGIAIEINNSSLCGSRKGSKENCHNIARLAAKKGNIVSIGTDAHFAPDVGRFDEAMEVVAEAGIKEEQVLNSSLKRILSYLTGRRAQRLGGVSK